MKKDKIPSLQDPHSDIGSLRQQLILDSEIDFLRQQLASEIENNIKKQYVYITINFFYN